MPPPSPLADRLRVCAQPGWGYCSSARWSRRSAPCSCSARSRRPVRARPRRASVTCHAANHPRRPRRRAQTQPTGQSAGRPAQTALRMGRAVFWRGGEGEESRKNTAAHASACPQARRRSQVWRGTASAARCAYARPPSLAAATRHPPDKKISLSRKEKPALWFCATGILSRAAQPSVGAAAPRLPPIASDARPAVALSSCRLAREILPVRPRAPWTC